MRLLIFPFLFISFSCLSQLPIDEEQFYARITPGTTLPEKLLSTRTVVFYPFNMTQQELDKVQEYCVRSGIDAVAYYETDLLMAGRDVSVAMAQKLNAREIANLIVFRKSPDYYTLTLFEYNRKANFIEKDQPTWSMENRILEEILKRLYLSTASGLKRENNLINEFPEPGTSVMAIDGKRNEFYALDLKVDLLAVPKFGDEEMDKQLEEVMKLYPFKYMLTDPTLSEAELRKQGYLFVLRFVNARARVSKRVLGYDLARSESGIASISWPGDQPQVKNIPANDEVFKFYFKHIESGNVFLGTKWDADQSWQQALVNQLKGFRFELRIN